jgi:hypothetical protein
MSAFSNVMNTIPDEYKNLIKKGILVVPINVFFIQYPNLKDSMINHIFNNIKPSDNTMHSYTSSVPINENEINGINNILWGFVREYYQLWNSKCPSYYGGFSIIYNKDNEQKLKQHIDDSLYTINMCIKKKDVEGSDIVFDGIIPNCYNSVYTRKNIFVPCKEDYMIIHLGNHSHQTNELISGERVNIILWFK